MIRRCSRLAASEPELLLPVFWTARWRAVEPLLFISNGSAPLSIRALNRARASSPDGPMQRGYTALVHGVGVCARIDEVGDQLALRIRIPVVHARASIRGVVERFGSPAVASANRGAVCEERLCESSLMGGGCDMQSRVARVDVMANRDKEVGDWILAAGSDPKRTDGQGRCLMKHSSNPDVVSGRDRDE